MVVSSGARTSETPLDPQMSAASWLFTLVCQIINQAVDAELVQRFPK